MVPAHWAPPHAGPTCGLRGCPACRRRRRLVREVLVRVPVVRRCPWLRAAVRPSARSRSPTAPARSAPPPEDRTCTSGGQARRRRARRVAPSARTGSSAASRPPCRRAVARPSAKSCLPIATGHWARPQGGRASASGRFGGRLLCTPRAALLAQAGCFCIRWPPHHSRAVHQLRRVGRSLANITTFFGVA